MISPPSSRELEENTAGSSPGLFPMQAFREDEKLARYFQLPRSNGDLWRSGIGTQVLGTASPDCLRQGCLNKLYGGLRNWSADKY